MASTLLYTYEDPVHPRHIERAIKLLAAGEVIAFPTASGWALGCSPVQRDAAARLLRLNTSHPRERPFSLLCADVAMASVFGHIDQHCYRCLRRLSLEGYTILVPATMESPKRLRDKRRAVGLRIAHRPLAQELSRGSGGPILITTAPLHLVSGTSPPTVFGFEVSEWGGSQLALVLDLGEGLSYRPSAVIDFCVSPPVFRRATPEQARTLTQLGLVAEEDE